MCCLWTGLCAGQSGSWKSKGRLNQGWKSPACGPRGLLTSSHPHTRPLPSPLCNLRPKEKTAGGEGWGPALLG